MDNEYWKFLPFFPTRFLSKLHKDRKITVQKSQVSQHFPSCVSSFLFVALIRSVKAVYRMYRNFRVQHAKGREL